MIRALLLLLSVSLLLISCDNGTGQALTSPVAPSPQFQQLQEGTDTTVALTAGSVLKFQFYPVIGQTYAIQTAGNTDITLELRDSADQQTLKADSLPEYINGYLTVTGTSNVPVWIVLKGKYSYTEGSTILQIRPISEVDKYEPDSSMATAQWIATDGKSQRHYLQPKDVDWVKFCGDSGKAYKVTLFALQKTSFSVYMDSSAPRFVTSGDEYGFKTFRTAKTGSVFISIANSSFGSGKGGDYWVNVSVDTTSPDRFEPDSTRATAHPIKADGVPQELTLLAGDVDWAKFQADSGKSYMIKTKGDFQGTLRVFSDSIASVEATYSYSSAVLKATKSGNMLISFKGFDINSAGHYALAVSVDTTADDAYENNDAKQNAKSITVNAAAQQHSMVPGDVDWVKFYGEAGKTYVFKATTNDSYSIFGMFEGETVSQTQSAEFEDRNPWSFVFTPTASGYFYATFALLPSSSSKRTYTVEVSSKN